MDLELATVFWPSAPLLGSDPCCFPSDLFNPEERRVAGIPDWGQAQAWGGEHSPIREDASRHLLERGLLIRGCGAMLGTQGHYGAECARAVINM